MPSTWAAYGVDANGDGRKDPYNPVDGICAAARYLKAAGGMDDLYNAIFAYNHADWYVDEVLLYARAYGRLPDDLVASLTGLTEGAHFPVAADARYADDIEAREALRRSTPARGTPDRQRRRRHLLLPHPARHQHLLPRGRPGRRRQRRRDQGDGPLPRARPLHRPPGRLRQPLHLRRPRQHPPGPPRAEARVALTPRTSRSSARPTTTRPSRPRPTRSRQRPATPRATTRSPVTAPAGTAAMATTRAPDNDGVTAAPVTSEHEGPHVNGGAQDVADRSDGQSDAGNAAMTPADDGPSTPRTCGRASTPTPTGRATSTAHR